MRDFDDDRDSDDDGGFLDERHFEDDRRADETPTGGWWDQEDDKSKDDFWTRFKKRQKLKAIVLAVAAVIGLLIEGGVMLFKKLNPPPPPGQRVDEFAEAGLPDPILIVPAEGNREELRFDGHPWAEVIEDHPLPGAAVEQDDTLEEGQLVLMDRGGNRWRLVAITEVYEGGNYRISYVGWGRGWDEDVHRSKLRYPDMVSILAESGRTLDGVSLEPDEPVIAANDADENGGVADEGTGAENNADGPAQKRLAAAEDGSALPAPVLVVNRTDAEPREIDGTEWAELVEKHPIPLELVSDGERLVAGQILLVERTPGKRWRAVLIRGETEDGLVQISYLNWSRGWDDETSRKKLFHPDMPKIAEAGGRKFPNPNDTTAAD